MDQLRSRFAAARARLEASGAGAWVAHASALVRTAWRRARWLRRTVVAPLRPIVRAAAAAARRLRDTVKPGIPPLLYTDGMITLDRYGVVISSYYLPFGRRRIPYERIRGFEEYPLSRGRGYRIHGFGWPRQWYHRDPHRAQRAAGLVLRTGDRLRPVITPVDLQAVRDILEERLAKRRRREVR